MREVTAVGEVHAEHLIAGLEHAEIDSSVGLRAGVRLHVSELGTEQFAGAVDGELLGLIDFLTTAIPALGGIAFRILVGQAGALSGHDGA